MASPRRKRLHPPGLFRSAGKHQKRYRPEMRWARRAASPGRPDGPAQRRSAPVSAGQRRSAPVSAGQRRSAPVSAGQGRSALADPGHRRLGLTGRKVLAITPGAAGAVVVMALPPWNADHAPIFPLFFPLSLAGRMKSAPRPGLAGTGLRRGLRDWLDVCDGLRYREEADRQACQAALARRIRRRRSAARSSSFRPPHTPYFSGRDSA